MSKGVGDYDKMKEFNASLCGNFYLNHDSNFIEFILREDYGKREGVLLSLLPLDKCVKYYYLNRNKYTTYAQAKMELDILPDYVLKFGDNGEASIGYHKYAKRKVKL